MERGKTGEGLGGWERIERGKKGERGKWENTGGWRRRNISSHLINDPPEKRAVPPHTFLAITLLRHCVGSPLISDDYS